MKQLAATLLFSALAALPSSAIEPSVARREELAGQSYVYKTSAGKERRMEVFFPPGHDPAQARVPGMILFHGGGWRNGSLAA